MHDLEVALVNSELVPLAAAGFPQTKTGFVDAVITSGKVNVTTRCSSDLRSKAIFLMARIAAALDRDPVGAAVRQSAAVGQIARLPKSERTRTPKQTTRPFCCL